MSQEREGDSTQKVSEEASGVLRRRLDAFMEEASERVAEWPEWKRNIQISTPNCGPEPPLDWQ